MAYTSIRYSTILISLGLIAACQSGDQPVTKDRQSIAEPESTQSVEKPTAKFNGQLNEDNATRFLEAYARANKANRAVIHTPLGDITIQLFRNTPLHRANFIYLARQNYFDGTWFYRISPGHVIQAGNNDESITGKKRSRIGDYHVPNEIDAGNLHLRGAVAAARSYYQNPGKESIPFEFYIVLGKSYTARELELLAEKEAFALNDRQRKAYADQPGSPHLDGQHTVFGQVVDGMEVVEAISRVETDDGEWPLENIPIAVEVID